MTGAASETTPLRLETGASSKTGTSRETILFLHGGGVGGWDWSLQAEALPEYHCLCPDLPGHGLRQRDSGFTIRGAATDAARLIQTRAGGGRAHVVGLSLGSQVGLQLVADYPELVNRALLSGPLVLPHWRNLHLTERLLKPINALLLSAYMPVRNLSPLVHANMRVSNVSARFETQFREDTDGRTVSGMMQTLEEYARFRVPENLGQSTVPTLLLVGEREPAIIHASARAILDNFPAARGYCVKDAEHTWNMGHPELFTATLRAWLQGGELPAALQSLVLSNR